MQGLILKDNFSVNLFKWEYCWFSRYDSGSAVSKTLAVSVSGGMGLQL